MPIQLLGLREYFDHKRNRFSKKEAFKAELGTADSVQEILENTNEYLQRLPEEEHFNLFFTVQHCFPGKGRAFEKQKYLFFDLDGIYVDQAEEYFRIFCDTLDLNPSKTCCILSGNGLHILIELPEPFEDVQYFEQNRVYYKAICSLVNSELDKKNLPGNVDPQPFAPAYMVRLPGTMNVKKKEGKSEVKILQGILEPQEWGWQEKSKIPQLERTDYISDIVVERIGSIDSDAVQDGCGFLKHCKENQNDVSEPMWYAMLSIVSRLGNGKELAHEYSCEYAHYSENETDAKIDQALSAAGPRTCNNISQMWDGCRQCPHFKTEIHSPIQIQGDDFIATEMHQFWITHLDKYGNHKPVRPDYEGLRRFFEQKHPYVTMESSSIVYIFYNNHWQEYPHNRLLNFAQKHFGHKDKLTSTHRNEFASLVSCTNIQSDHWFNTPGLLNLQNGVLDIKERKLLPHSLDYGFRYILPFEYDPHALAPRFEKFLEEITLNKKELQDVLLEYMAYCLSGLDPSWGEKAMILIGEGSNGKSVFMDVLRNLMGENTYSSLSMSDLAHEAHRYQLDGSLCNISEETPSRSMLESSLFKNLVTGGEVMVKKLYSQPYRIKNMTKLLLACNELPPTNDTTMGMIRRLLIVPFNATFLGSRIDRNIRKKLKEERPGILNMVLGGYDKLIEQEHFTPSKIVEGEVKNYIKDNDSVIRWCEDNLTIVEPGDCDITINELYSEYRLEMEKKKIYFVSQLLFSKRLRRYLVNESRFERKRVEGRRLTVVKGVILGEEKEGF